VSTRVVPVLKTSATTGEGIADLDAALTEHRQWLERTGALGERRRQRAAAEIEAIALAQVRARFGQLHGTAALAVCAARVVAGQTDPYTAADQLVTALT
jgi:LAO/AO transport system kinase